MPIAFARGLTGRQRTTAANRQLGCALALNAGAVNAGAYVAVQRYTSHMTGIVSTMADGLASGAFDVALGGLAALLSFMGGAACSALMVNYARRRHLHAEYAGPLMLEAALLLVFGVLGSRLAHLHALFVPATVMLLSFIMGLQNALMTKLSHAEIRTTHVTGIVTDLGIELGRMAYWNRSERGDAARVMADRVRLRLLASLLGCFFLGGVLGAVGFARYGYRFTVPLALFLVLLAAVPAVDDMHAWVKQQR